MKVNGSPVIIKVPTIINDKAIQQGEEIVMFSKAAVSEHPTKAPRVESPATGAGTGKGKEEKGVKGSGGG